MTGSADRTARVWKLTDAAIGATSVVLSGHDGAVIGTVIAPHDDSSITVVTIDGANQSPMGGGASHARMWELQADLQPPDPKPVAVTHNGLPVSVSFFTPSHDGSRLLLAGGKTAFVVELLAGSPAPPPIVLHAHESNITTAAFAWDGRSVATGAADKTARLWRLRPVRPPAQPSVIPAGYDARFAVSPDGRRLVTIGSDSPDGPSSQVAVLWDLTSPDVPTRSVLLHGHTGRMGAVLPRPGAQAGLPRPQGQLSRRFVIAHRG